MKALLNSSELSVFFEQLSLTLHSGISSLEGISIMLEDSDNGEGQDILQTIYTHLEETGCLYESLKISGVFPDYAVNMMELGEKTGRMDEVSSALSEYYERENSISSAIRGAVTYPLVMLGMMLVVILVLILKVMPVFEQVFEQLGLSMTGFSALILNMGKAMNSYSVVFLILLALIAGCILYFTKSSKGRRQILTFLHNSKLTGKISEKIACSRFAGSMSIALQSGMDTEESMEMLFRLTEQPKMRDKIQIARDKLLHGEDFPEAFAASGIFTGLYRKMVTIGYRTGSMDQVMDRIARQYEEEIDTEIQRVIGLIEPTMVAVLSIIVGLILLSVMLPLTGIMAGIG